MLFSLAVASWAWGCGGKPDAPSSTVALAGGGYQSCALRDDGELRCWGRNDRGEMGLGFVGHIGDDESPSSITTKAFSERAVAISTGTSHSCAVLESGQARLWLGDQHRRR